MKTHHPWRQNTPLLANVGFKESLPHTFTTLRGGHVTLCVLTVPVHEPQFPRSLGGSSNRSASRLILNLGVLSWYSPVRPCPLQNTRPRSRRRVSGPTGLCIHNLRSQNHWSHHMALLGYQLCLARPTAQCKVWTLNHLPVSYCHHETYQLVPIFQKVGDLHLLRIF